MLPSGVRITASGDRGFLIYNTHMAEGLIDRRTFLQGLAGGLAGFAMTPLFGKPIDDSEHVAYHAARSIFPVVQGTIHVAEAVQQIDCPIYMFHRPALGTVYSIVVENLNVGRVPITVTDLAQGLLGEKNIPEKPFCLSFDDGYLIQYQQIFPFLKQWSIPATFNVMGTGWQGDGVHSYMTVDQIREISEQGSEIASHTVNHANLLRLRALNRGAYLAEIFDSKVQLEEILNKQVSTFAYPMGAYDNQVISDVAAARYKAALSTRDFRVQAFFALYYLGRSRR